jgi:DNA-binding IclR family transcriptional regulator
LDLRKQDIQKSAGSRKQMREPKRPPARKAALPSSTYSIDVIDKTAAILAVFSDKRPSLALRNVVAQTGLPKTTVFRILSSLVAHDFCELDPSTGQYSLGFAFIRFADVRRRQSNLQSLALPIMREIRNEIGETIVLSIRSGDYRVHLDVVEGLHPMRRTAELGVRAPLYAGAASKVLLAGLDDAEIAAYLARTELTSFQKNTITSKETLWKELRQTRARGYAESRSELIPGGGSVAAPVCDYTGKTVAVMDILTPDDRYTTEHRARCVAVILEYTRRVSERLGFR